MTTDTAPTPVPRWQQVALALSMFLTTGSFGFLQPFVPLYLQASGLNKTQYGLAIALGTGVGIIVQPLLGRLSDRLDARRPLMVASALAAMVAYLLYPRASGFWEFTALTALGTNGFQYLNAVGGTLVGRLIGSGGGGAAYVRFRVWGSVGYILIGFTAGLLVQRSLPTGGALTRTVLDPLFLYGPLLFLLLAVVSLCVPDIKRKVVSGQWSVISEKGDDARATTTAPSALPIPQLTTDHRPLTTSPDLRPFFASVFLYQFALYGASAFLPLYMKQLGAAPLLLSAMFAGGVIVEVLTMTQVGKWTDRYGRRPALAATFLLLPVRLLLYIPATGPLWVIAVQMLHGINFGIMGTMAVVYLNDCAGENERGALQARFAGCLGLANAIGPLVCGALSDTYGIRPMFALMAGVAVAGVTLFLSRVRESHPTPETPPGPLRYLA